MKYFCSSMLLTLLVLLSFAQAATGRTNSKENIHKTCTYKYLDCKDTCDYIQDQTKIRSCKAQCNRKFHCRPKKVRLPAKNLLEQ